MHELVSDLNIYRDGDLPVSEQLFEHPEIHILRCSYWIVRTWHHANLSSPYWRLYWNRQPGAEVKLGEHIHALTPDRLVLVAPNTPFTSQLKGDALRHPGVNIMEGRPYESVLEPLLERSREQLVCHFFIHFTASLPYDQIQPQIFSFRIGDEARALVDELTESLGLDRHRFGHRQTLALRSLVYMVLGQVPPQEWPAAQTDARVVRVLQAIDSQLERTWVNEDFGRLAHMSPNAFTRLFRAKTGCTPLEHLKTRRVEKASILLHHTDLTLDAIAQRCGFCDRYYFTRIFRQTHKVGPATYRKHRPS